MNKWLWAVLLALQAHFGASYVAPTQPDLGFFNYIWPWAVGDRGIFGVHPNLPGIALGGLAGILSGMSALAVVGIWVPYDWWRNLAIAGAVLEIVVMLGFFGPHKFLPVALDLGMLAAILYFRLPVK